MEIWLSGIPGDICDAVLSPVEFRDELRDRYGLDILNSTSYCDGLNSNFQQRMLIVIKLVV